MHLSSGSLVRRLVPLFLGSNAPIQFGLENRWKETDLSVTTIALVQFCKALNRYVSPYNLNKSMRNLSDLDTREKAINFHNPHDSLNNLTPKMRNRSTLDRRTGINLHNSLQLSQENGNPDRLR